MTPEQIRDAADRAEGKQPKKGRTGRPTVYKQAFAEQAVKLSSLGATDAEMADFFGVSVRTLHRWKLENEDFCHSVKSGKSHADERVERSLYQRASGYEYTEQQAVKVKRSQHEEEVRIVDVVKHAPPDTTAAIFWLKNRRPEQWRDKRELEHSGTMSLNVTPEDADL